MEHEVKQKQDLLNDQGMIREPGWARGPVWKYNRDKMKTPWFRKKEWDYYLIANEAFAFGFTISDLGYAGLISVSFIDFVNKKEKTKTIMEPLTRGKKYGLGTSSENGFAKVRAKQVQMYFDKSVNKRKIVCHWVNFLDGKDLDARIVIEQRDMDSICIATPWKEKRTAFYYNEKINCMPTQGIVTIGNTKYVMKKDTSFAVLDWGRGVWTYDNTWYWGTGSGMIEGIPFGFNLGYGFSDRSHATENVLFYQNKVHKLDAVTFVIPRDQEGNLQYTKTWKITSSDGRFEGSFEPILDRNADINFKLIISNQHQVFGNMNAIVILDDGTELVVKKFICALEVVHNRY
ncbi:MAG: DUF2804 domain-containing protein [Velocimicrobium sp.]